MSEHAAPPAGGERPVPIVVPPGASAALASQPEGELDHAYHAYDANPAPWWVGLLWICFLVGGAIYLVQNVME